MATKLLFRAEDLDWLQAKRGQRLELIRGEVFELTTAEIHGVVLSMMAYLFESWNRIHKAGRFSIDVGWKLEHDPDTVRGPDISFVRAGRPGPVPGYPEMVPDFVVEIRSPNNTWPDLVDKVEQFLARGTQLAWLVQVGEFVEVRRSGQEPHRLRLDDELTAPDILPGFSCRVRELFPE